MWALASFAITVASSIVAAAIPTSGFPDPNLDPFYRAPGNIASYSPGAIVRARPATTTLVGNAVQSFQIFYRTTDQQGNPLGTVATVWSPAKPRHPPSLLSFQYPEDALNIDCAPSWAWVNRTSVVEVENQNGGGVVVPFALSKGYYVVNSDNEGLKSAYLAGGVEGRAVLDGIRAAVSHLGLSHEKTGAALYGYSGGAHATAWASSLAHAYAPELKIIGAAMGGTPVDFRTTFDQLNKGPAARLAGGILLGLMNAYPDLNSTLSSLLTPKGCAIVQKMRSPNYCLTEQGADFANLDFTTLFTKDIRYNTVVNRIWNRESLLMNVSYTVVPVPKFPIFEWHGMKDTTVPYSSEAQYVAQQCGKGADIRFLTMPDSDHLDAYWGGTPGALQFIQRVFDGNLEKSQCGANISVPAIGSKESVDLLGSVVDTVLASLRAEHAV